MMGTGGFALPTFHALLEGRRVVGLFTQPDRTGRGHHQHVNPLKELAGQHGIPVFQPPKVNEAESIEQLGSLRPDLCVVAAYGQILSPQLLAVPARGAINVHASLLPKYRGAAPIQTAILNDETETGVTIFQIEPKLDAGPILAIEHTPIGPKETSCDLEARLAVIGASLTLHVLDQIEAGSLRPIVQEVSLVSRAPRLKKEDGRVDWTKTPRQIDCQVRAMQPWPTAYSTLVHQSLDPSRTSLTRLTLLEVAPAAIGETKSVPPGTVLMGHPNQFLIQTGTGAIELVRVRPEGKRSMTAAEFLRGRPVAAGDYFETM